MKIIHFADAHIDTYQTGKQDPQTGLPYRALDFLKSLDEITDRAISEKVELVLFAGDAYKDRNPSPTFQKEWDYRMMKLSAAGIRTVLLVGNHDTGPAYGKAHAFEELTTLQVPNITVVDKPMLLKPGDIGIPVQIIAIPWLYRSGLTAALELHGTSPEKVYETMQVQLERLIGLWLSQTNPKLPVILAAHASASGAKYGAERSVSLGNEMVLSGSILKDDRWDYVALGHIHKAQNLNIGEHPPVIYPGSIERVDFGEQAESKFYVLANVEKGSTDVEWCELENIRPFVNLSVTISDPTEATSKIIKELEKQKLDQAMVRLVVEYPRECETNIDEKRIREVAKDALEFRFSRRPQSNTRVRIPANRTAGSLSPEELLEIYLDTTSMDEANKSNLQLLGSQIISEVCGVLDPEAS